MLLWDRYRWAACVCVCVCMRACVCVRAGALLAGCAAVGSRYGGWQEDNDGDNSGSDSDDGPQPNAGAGGGSGAGAAAGVSESDLEDKADELDLPVSHEVMLKGHQKVRTVLHPAVVANVSSRLLTWVCAVVWPDCNRAGVRPSRISPHHRFVGLRRAHV